MHHAHEVTRVARHLAARLIVDTQSRICEASDAAHELLGYPSGALLGLSLAWILPPSRNSLLEELSAAFRNGGRLCLPGALMREDGGLVQVLLITHPCSTELGPALALQLELDGEPSSARTRARP